MADVTINLIVTAKGLETLGTAGKKFDTLGKKAKAASKTASNSLAALGKSGQKLGGSLESLGGKVSGLGTSLTALALPIVGIGAAAVRASVDFERSFLEMQNLVGVSTDELAGFREEILKLGPEVGVGPRELASAMFAVTSAGARGAEAMDILTESSKAAALGLGETKTISLAVVAATTAYGKENLSAAQATEALVNTVKFGNLEASQLAGTLGRVTPIASQMGVTFQDVGAFIATFTRLGGDASEATTSLRGLLNSIAKPGQQAKDAFEAMGTSAGKLKIQLGEEGLAKTLVDLVTAADGDTEALGAVIPNVRALTGVLATAGAQGEDFIDIANQMANSTGTIAEGMKNLEGTASFSFAQFRAKGEAALIKFGDAIAPSLVKLLDTAILPMLDKVELLAQKFTELPPGVQQGAIALLGLAAVAGPLLILFGQLTAGLGRFIQIGSSGLGVLAKFGGEGAMAAGGISKLTGAFTTASGGLGSMTAGIGTATGATVAMSAAAAGVALVVSSQATRAFSEWGDELRGIDDPIKNAVAEVGLFEGAVSLASDVLSGMGRFLVDVTKGFLDWAANIPLVGEALALVQSIVEGLAIKVSELGDFIARNTEFLFAYDDSAQQATLATSQLYTASQIAGEEITDQAEAERIISQENERLSATATEAAEATVEEGVAAEKTAEQILAEKQAAEAAAKANDEFKQAVESAANSLETLSSATRDFGVIQAAVASVGGIGELTGAGLENLRTSLVELNTAGVDTGTMLEQVDARLKELGLDEVSQQAKELASSFMEFTAAGAAEELEIFKAALGDIPAVADLSEQGALELASQLEALEARVGTLPPEFDALRQELADLGFDEAGRQVRDFVKELEAGGFATGEKRVATLTAGIDKFGGVSSLTAKQVETLAKEAEGLGNEGQALTGTLQEVIAKQNELAKSARVDELTKQFQELNGVVSQETVEALSEVESAIMAATENGTAGTQEFQDAAAAALDEIAAKSPGAAAAVEEIKDKFDIASSGAINFGSIMGDLANIMQSFGISASSGIGQAVAGLQQIGSSLPAIRDFDKSILGSTQGAERFQAAAGGVASGIAGIASATASGGPAIAAARGAMAGAAAGGQIGGPIGAGIGAAIGGVVGFFRGRGRKKLASEIKNTVGATVSEELAKAIKDGAKKAGRTVEQESLLSIGTIISTEGFDAFEDGVAGASKATLDLLQGVADGSLPAKEGLAGVGEAFSLIAQESLIAGQVADAELINIVKATRELGQEVPEIAAFVADQLGMAAQGVGKLVGGIQIVDPADAQAQATIFAATFFATMEEVGLLEAVDAFQPAFEELQKQLAQFGGDVNLGGVGRIFEIAGQEEFRPLLEGVQGLDEALQGLANTGFLTTDSFSAFQQQAGSAFEQLQSAGLSSAEALQQMGPLLNNLVQASNEFGIPLDANTQSLVDQAKAAGVAFRVEPMQQMAGALTVIAELLGATDEQLASIGTTAATTGTQVQGAFGEGAAAGAGALQGAVAGVGETVKEVGRQVREDLPRSMAEAGEAGGSSLRDGLQRQFGRDIIGEMRDEIPPAMAEAGVAGGEAFQQGIATVTGTTPFGAEFTNEIPIQMLEAGIVGGAALQEGLAASGEGGEGIISGLLTEVKEQLPEAMREAGTTGGAALQEGLAEGTTVEGVLEPLNVATTELGENLRTQFGPDALAGLNEGLAMATGQVQGIGGEFENVGGNIAELPEVANEAVTGIATAFNEGSASITEGLGPIGDKMATEIKQAGAETAAATKVAFDETNKAIESGLGEVASTFAGPVTSSAERAASAARGIADAAREAAKAASEIDFPNGGGGGGPGPSAATGFRGVLGRDTNISAHKGEFVSITPAAETRRMSFVSAQNGMGPSPFAVSMGDRNVNLEMNGGGESMDETLFRNRILPLLEEAMLNNDREIVQRIREQVFEEVR